MKQAVSKNGNRARTGSVRGKQKRVKARKGWVTGKSVVSPPQQARIKAAYIAGTPIREIARNEGRNAETVTKIVRSPDMQQYVEDLTERYTGLGLDALKSVAFAVRTEMDGQLSRKLLIDIGVIKPQASQLQVQLARARSPEEILEDGEVLKQEWAKRLGMLALERHEVYGASLPEDVEVVAVKKNGHGEKA
jgi:hypothetical protein